mgnify:CR=1 FL=1
MLALQTCRKGRKPLMRFLYSALFYCLVPLLLLRMVLRSRREHAEGRRVAVPVWLFETQALTQQQPLIRGNTG